MSILKCHVDMYGLSSRITERTSVVILLEERPCFEDIVAALRNEIPSMVGEVIRSEGDRLTDSYILNVNGTVYADYNETQGDGVLALKDGDRIALLPLSSGG